MLKELINLANHLDKKGLRKEADALDFVIKKAMNDDELYEEDDESKEPDNDMDLAYERYKLTNKLVYVSLYETERAYGGPEEGGWWYDEYKLEGSKAFTDEEEALDYRDWLRDKIKKEQSLGHRYNRPIHSADGFENLPDDQIPIGFSGNARDYEVRIEDSPGEMARRPAPHYE